MEKIILHEVGLRDGLQNEKKLLPTELKLQWLDKLISSNIDIIQVGSFVHPTKVPQMADTDEIFEQLKDRKKVLKTTFSGLVLNERGLERALKCDVDLICMGVSASETHSNKNTGMDTTEATTRIIAMAQEAVRTGKKVQVSVQSAFGCGFEGEIHSQKVYSIINAYLNAGLHNISLADTAGHAHPKQVKEMFGHISSLSDEITLTCHFHDTYGMGIANVFAAMDSGVKYFETAIGGLGGCPFTKVAAGNVTTEDVVHTFKRFGMLEHIDLESLIELSKEMSSFFEKDLPGYVYKTGVLSY